MTATIKAPKGLSVYIIVLFLLTVFLRIILIFYYNSNYSGIEQNVIYGIQRILLGQPLYQDPSIAPYAVMQYTPLYYYFIASIAKGIGIDALDLQGIYMICRTTALLCNLLTALTVVLIIRTWRLSWYTSIIFALPVVILVTTHYYTRGDSMHLFLFVAAIYSYILYNKSGGLKHLLIAALFSGGCIVTKQSGVLVSAIISYSLLFTGRKYLATIFYCLCTFCVAYIIALVCVQGNWHEFYQNAVLGLKNGTDFTFLYLLFTSQYFLEIVPCYFLGGIIVWLATKKITDPIFRIIATGAGLSFLFAVVTGLKVGSSNNYFCEFLVFVIAAIPYLLQSEWGKMKLFRFSGRAFAIRSLAFVALFILVTSKTLGLFTAMYIDRSVKDDKDEYTKEKELYQYVSGSLKLNRGEYVFFTDRLFLDNIFVEYSIMPTKDVVSQVYATDHNTYNYAAFITGMNTGMVKYIITTENKKDINEWNATIPFIFFDKNKFRLFERYLGYSIYVYVPG